MPADWSSESVRGFPSTCCFCSHCPGWECNSLLTGPDTSLNPIPTPTQVHPPHPYQRGLAQAHLMSFPLHLTIPRGPSTMAQPTRLSAATSHLWVSFVIPSPSVPMSGGFLFCRAAVSVSESCCLPVFLALVCQVRCSRRPPPCSVVSTHLPWAWTFAPLSQAPAIASGGASPLNVCVLVKVCVKG